LLRETDPQLLALDHPIRPRPTLKLDDDMVKAIQKMERIEVIANDLPGLDCGSCGAPNCRALAEDIVCELAAETDCIFILREKVRELADELQSLASKVPPAMGHGKKDATNNAAIQHSRETELGPSDR
jgi:Na+-translocating ferredoxin:NAD+ oxidoreductase RNF subunit RnfB